MTKLELIDKVSLETGKTKKETADIINCFLANIKQDVISGNKVVISNFGTFYKKDLDPYKVFNPQNGEEMIIKDSIRIYFNSSKQFRNMK